MTSIQFKSIFIVISIIGIYLSLHTGISHDELHDLLNWQSKKIILNNFFLNKEIPNFWQDPHYGVGFHLISLPFELILDNLLNLDKISENGKILILKHPTVYLFFLLSALCFKKIIYFLTKDKSISYITTLFFLFYPYLLGHSFFNIKDIPFMSIWLLVTYQTIRIIQKILKNQELLSTKSIVLLSLSVAFLISIRLSGVLMFIQLFIFFLFFIHITKIEKNFLKNLVKHFVIFFIFNIFFIYILSPQYWHNPLFLIDGIIFMSNHIQTVCTLTLGTCMKAQNLPASYIFIWMLFKLPLIILLGVILIPFTEKKIFNNNFNIIIFGSLLLTVITILLILVIMNVNLYDELRQILFIIPLILILSFTSFYFFSKRLTNILTVFFIIFFIFQNLKIYPYNYVWFNNLNAFIKINNKFELDYWGLSGKEIANFLNNERLTNECIITIREDSIKPFLENKNLNCFKKLNALHQANARPFYIALIERSLDKGLPQNCESIHQSKISVNLSNEELILSKLFKCY